MKYFRKNLIHLIYPVLAISSLLSTTEANAVPLFERQTGMKCASCHMGGNFFELTKTGRNFKLMGYTQGDRQTIPLAGMLQLSMTKVSSYNGSTASAFPRDGDVIAQQISLFTGGKITDNIGAFVQWTTAPGIDANGVVKYHGGIDNTDIRFAQQTKLNGKDVIYGLSLNNNPSVQDVFNTTPAWSGSTMISPSGGGMPGVDPVAATQIEGLSQHVAGLGAYVDWNDFLYAELSGYKTANGIFSALRAGDDTAGASDLLSGTNPYWRLALHGDSGPQSWEIGTYGMITDQYSDPSNNSSPTDRFKDYAIDGQYQYVHGKNFWSTQATWIHEKRDWYAGAYTGLGVAGGDASDNASDTLNTARIKGSYFYNRKVGGTVGLFSTTGSNNSAYGTATGSPDTRGYTLEADYLPTEKIKVALQYTGFNKFNGSSDNYDGTGRNASDNNTVYLLGWFMF
ncbi:MAG: cytochrome C [Burkholderiales bacterium]